MFSFDDKRFFGCEVGKFPKEKPHFTPTEDMLHTQQMMKETIDRLLKFEQRTKTEVSDLLREVTADNVTFKKTMRELWITFSDEVKNEINLFESNTDNAISLFIKNIESDYANLSADCKQQIETIVSLFTEKLTAFENSITDSFNTFKDFVNTEIQNYNENLETSFNDYKKSLTAKVEKFITQINTDFNTYKTEINTLISERFTTIESIVNDRLDSQDNEISGAVAYMKTNLSLSVDELLQTMKDNGEINGFLSSDLFPSPKKYEQYGAGDPSISACAQMHRVFFIEKEYTSNNTIDLPGADVTIIGIGGKLINNSAKPLFRQTKRGFKTRFININYEGVGSLFEYDSDDSTLPANTSCHELDVINCTFTHTDNSNYSLYLKGVRESLIQGCTFNSGAGIYVDMGININVDNCIFRSTSYIVACALGSEGIKLSNITAIGCTYGAKFERVAGVQINNSMIDYCGLPLELKGCNDVLISNNYISTATNSTNVAVNLDAYNGYKGHDIKFISNTIKANGDSVVLMYVLNTTYAKFIGNNIKKFKTRGIVMETCAYINFENNDITGETGCQLSVLIDEGDDSTIKFLYNVVNAPIRKSTYRGTCKGNSGFVTENRGEAVISSGSSTVTVTHNLAHKPSKQDILLTPSTGGLSGVAYYVSSVTDTTFTITLGAVADNNIGIVWQIFN